jgi:hypothetical protein
MRGWEGGRETRGSNQNKCDCGNCTANSRQQAIPRNLGHRGARKVGARTAVERIQKQTIVGRVAHGTLIVKLNQEEVNGRCRARIHGAVTARRQRPRVDRGRTDRPKVRRCLSARETRFNRIKDRPSENEAKSIRLPLHSPRMIDSKAHPNLAARARSAASVRAQSAPPAWRQ